MYNLTIDYIGIWNERPIEPSYVVEFRKALNNSPFKDIEIVVADGKGNHFGVCSDLADNKEYRDAISIIGLHYPGDFNNFSQCHAQGKKFWASEEASAFNDLNGAGCWARVITSHFVQSQITSSTIWNLVGAYYHGTDWYASSLMTAVQPWSGYYEVAPVLWATAHVTQFTKIGWRYLNYGAGSGNLSHGGFFATFVDPETNDFTINIAKISWDHSLCARPDLPRYEVFAESVTFQLSPSLANIDTLAVWYSNFEQGPDSPIFEKQKDVTVENGLFTIHVPIGSFFTISTIRTAIKGSFGSSPDSMPSFPLPLFDDFNNYPISSEAKYFTDQIGVFEIHRASVDYNSHQLIMRQMVPAEPISWDVYDQGPMSLLGMREWSDVKVTIAFFLPSNAPNNASACIATRSDQVWSNGIVVCVSAESKWQLSYRGPSIRGQMPEKLVVSSGATSFQVNVGKWYVLSLTTIGSYASASLDREPLFANTAIRNLDTGFVAIGTNGWYAIEFDKIAVEKAGDNWVPISYCEATKVGDTLTTRPCPTNGFTSDATRFNLLSNWLIRHISSGLCVTAASAKAGSRLVLAECNPDNPLQKFMFDDTRIRSNVMQLHLINMGVVLSGAINGTASVDSGESNKTRGVWTSWVYFPNTNQLRNQYVANTTLGYPMCLSTCKAAETGFSTAGRSSGQVSAILIAMVIAVTSCFRSFVVWACVSS